MTTLTSQENIDKERIWNVWELPRWARVQVHYIRQEIWKPDEEWDCIAVFNKIDWMYWQWFQEWTDEIMIFNWMFKQIDEHNFRLLEDDEVKGN